MSAKKKLFNNLKDYTKGVMKSQDFVDYMKVVVENYLGSHKKARTETLSLANEAKTLREAYAVLNATILTMEDSMVGCFNEFTSGITKEHFDTIMATIGKYLSLPEVLLFMYQNLKDFDDNAATLDTCIFQGCRDFLCWYDWRKYPACSRKVKRKLRN